MDFIVLGGILGAVMMVAGTIMRDLVPRRLVIAGDEIPWIHVRDQRRKVRTVRAAGRVATLAGIVVLLVTLVLVLLDASDQIAWTTVTGLALVAIVVCVAWVFWFRYQESSGALQRRQLRAVSARLRLAQRSATLRDRPRQRTDMDRTRPEHPLGDDQSLASPLARHRDRGSVPDRTGRTDRPRGRDEPERWTAGARPASRSNRVPKDQPADRPAPGRGASADIGTDGGEPRPDAPVGRSRGAVPRSSQRPPA